MEINRCKGEKRSWEMNRGWNRLRVKEGYFWYGIGGEEITWTDMKHGEGIGAKEKKKGRGDGEEQKIE